MVISLFVFVQAWSEIACFRRLLSRICIDVIVVFGDVLSKMGAPALGRVLERVNQNDLSQFAVQGRPPVRHPGDL